MLRGLILKDTPVAKEEEYRIEVIMNIRNLERLDKDIFTDEERQEAQEVRELLTRVQSSKFELLRVFVLLFLAYLKRTCSTL